MPEYSEKVKEYVKHPRNEGKIDNADSEAEVVSPVCGDSIKIYLKVEDNIIKDLKWETLGCAASVATSSAISEMVKGKTLDEAMNITHQQVIDFLGGLPNVKIHCSELAIMSLHKAIKQYRETHESS